MNDFFAKVFAAIFAVFLLGWIGSWFGDIGTFIGVLLGLFAAVGMFMEDGKETKDPQGAIPNPEKYTEPPRLSKPISPPALTSLKHDLLYSKVVTEVLAASIVADGIIEESEIEMAMSLIESDEFTTKKREALEELRKNIDEFDRERKKSKAVFNLKMTTVIHRAKEITDALQKERIIVMAEGMLDAITTGKRADSHDFLEKLKKALALAHPELSKKDAAEQFILKSSDPEAIYTLHQMHENPREYKERLTQAATTNPIMRTALGVFTGMIAANLVTGVIYQNQLNAALENFEGQLGAMGGIENLSLADDGAFVQDGYGEDGQSLEDFSIAGSDGVSGVEVASAEELDTDADFDFDDDLLG